jgi:hypothetical protein
MQSDDDVGKVAAASTHLVGTSLPRHGRRVPYPGHAQRSVPQSSFAHRHSVTHALALRSTVPMAAVALEEFLSEVVNGAATVAISRGSKNLAPAHIKAHVMMEPTLDFCRSVVQHAPGLTEEGADGVQPKAKKERKPKAAGAESKITTAKKRKAGSEEEEEEEWRTEDDTDEDAADEGAEAAGDADDEDVKVDLGDLADLDVDALVGEDALEERDVGGAAEEENFDEF